MTTNKIKQVKRKVGELNDLIDAIRNKNEADYGRPLIPSCVKVEVDIYAANQKISKKTALAELAESAGSYEKLESTINKAHQRRQRKAKKIKAIAKDQSKKSNQVSSYTKIIEASKMRRFTPIVLGGAPGLGKKS